MIIAGSLVVCVDDNFPSYIWGWARELPRKGMVYTVKAVGNGREPVTGEAGPGLVLFELNNPISTGCGQVRFADWRFREHFIDDEEQDESCEFEVYELCDV